MNKYIEIKNLSFKYARGRRVFKDLSLNINKDESTIITGKNGSGKTTLTKLIIGILKAQSGNIKIFGQDTQDLSLGEIGEKIGYVFQYPERQLFAQSVVEELTFPLILKGHKKSKVYEKADKLMSIFYLEEVRDSYPFQLSYGEKRRLAIASVLMNDPEYLILDEPTSSLDGKMVDVLSDILRGLREKNIGFLIISHDKDFVKKHGERIINIEGGMITRDERV